MKGNITRRGKTSWRLKWDAGQRDPVTGKRAIHVKTVRGKRADAERELRRILGTLDQGTYAEPSRMTVGAFLTDWLATRQHDVAESTYARHRDVINVHLIPALGAHLLTRLAPTHIENLYARLRSEGRAVTFSNGYTMTRPPLSGRSALHIHRLLFQALKAAVRLGLLVRNPASLVNAPRAKRTEMAVLDPEQSRALLAAAQPTALWLPVLLALTTGMRRGEILALRWADVDLAKGRLSVSRSLVQIGQVLSFKTPKSARSRRTIALPHVAIDALRRHRMAQAERFLALGIRQGDDCLIVSNPLGQPMRPSAVTKNFADLARSLRLRTADHRIRFHDLRHTHLTLLLAAGVHPKIASERAGHASVSITLDTYSHMLPNMQDEAAQLIDTALNPAALPKL